MSSLPRTSTLSRLVGTHVVAPVIPVAVDPKLATAYLVACEHGDIDACHHAVLQLQQTYPDCTSVKPSAVRVHQPLSDLIGYGFTKAATLGHVEMLEFLLSSHFSMTLRDGVCGDAQRFPPFAALQEHELVVCVQSIRYVCFAALGCIDHLAMPTFQMLVETRTLWDHEASLCLAFAMRRAIAAASNAASPAAFHPMIVLLTRHYDFLIDEIREFHTQFQPRHDGGLNEHRKFDCIKALQASLLYEIVLKE